VTLEVRDTGTGGGHGDGTGHGLVGMRERVAMFGGELDASPAPGGGFAVRAPLPVVA
jgi:signal transduction histidine kinase